MRDAAAKVGDVERMQAWAGQSAGLAATRPAGDIARDLSEGALAMLG
jgi:nitronate monooxygenase